MLECCSSHQRACGTLQYGQTALHVAAVNNHSEVVTKLVDAEANVDAQDKVGCLSVPATLLAYTLLRAPLLASCGWRVSNVCLAVRCRMAKRLSNPRKKERKTNNKYKKTNNRHSG